MVLKPSRRARSRRPRASSSSTSTSRKLMATISVFGGFPARTGIPASRSRMVRAVRCLAVRCLAVRCLAVRRHRLGIRLVLALAAVLMTGGCRVDATVEADVHDSGGGTVTARFSLDREALAVLGA